MIQGDEHVQAGAVVQRGDVKVGVDDLHFVVRLDVSAREITGADHVDLDLFRAVREELERQFLEVENQLRDIFLHAGNRRKLMLNALDTDARRRHAGQAVQQHATQGIAQSLAEAALQRFHHKASELVVFRKLRAFDVRLFKFCDHWVQPSCQVPSFLFQMAAIMQRHD